MNILDALQLQVTHYSGGRESLAPRVNKGAEVLRKELSGSASHKLGALDALAIARMCVETNAPHCYAYAQSINTSEVVPHARSLVTQVLDVLYCACEEIGAEEVWGLYNLATWLDSKFEAAEGEGDPDFGTLGANTVTTLAVLRLVNQTHDSSLINAAETILLSAREMLLNAEESSLLAKRAGGSHA